MPPDVETSSDAATVTVTASVAGVSGQAQIALAAGTVPGHHRTIASPATMAWFSATFADGVSLSVATTARW